MGIIVISAGCEVRSRVQGKSGDPSCHSAGGRGWACCRLQAQEDEGAAGEDPQDRGCAPSLMDIPAVPQGRQSPGGQRGAKAEPQPQGAWHPPPPSIFPRTSAELVLGLPAALP